MEYSVEMGSGAMIYRQSFIKFSSAIRKMLNVDSEPPRQHDDRISFFFFFFKINEVG
jgi:hypothetical protein